MLREGDVTRFTASASSWAVLYKQSTVHSRQILSCAGYCYEQYTLTVDCERFRGRLRTPAVLQRIKKLAEVARIMDEHIKRRKHTRTHTNETTIGCLFDYHLYDYHVSRTMRLSLRLPDHVGDFSSAKNTPPLYCSCSSSILAITPYALYSTIPLSSTHNWTFSTTRQYVHPDTFSAGRDHSACFCQTLLANPQEHGRCFFQPLRNHVPGRQRTHTSHVTIAVLTLLHFFCCCLSILLTIGLHLTDTYNRRAGPTYPFANSRTGRLVGHGVTGGERGCEGGH